MPCPHEFHERESSVYTEGLCPICLVAEITRLRRWVYATARSFDRSGLTLEEYNAITQDVIRTQENA